MRLLAACSIGGAGHLNPLLGVLHDPAPDREDLVVAPPALGDLVVGAGHRFWPGGESPEDELAPVRDQLALLPADEAAVLGNRELFGRLATTAMLPAMQRAFREWHPDVVLRDPTEYASAVLAVRTRTPMAQVAISFSDVEEGSTRIAAPALERHEPGLVEALMGAPYLTRFPASLDPSPYPRTIRYHEAAVPVTEELPDWWADHDAPLVYMTFGSVLGTMTFSDDVYGAALRAVESLDARVLLTVGRHLDPARLGPLPPHVHVERWVDQSRALPLAEMVICHGGSGTVLGALAAGLPTVVVPSFADQFENGRRIERVGAGRLVAYDAVMGARVRRPPDLALAPRIAEAARDVLSNDRYGHEARRIAAEIASTPEAPAALATVLSER